MMDINEAAEILQTKESVLAKLLIEKEKLSHEIEGLQMIHSMALSSVAAGDKSKSKEINDLVNQMAPLRYKLEVLLNLVNKATEDVQAAQKALDQEKEGLRRNHTLSQSL
jgi:hypothetical protein